MGVELMEVLVVVEADADISDGTPLLTNAFPAYSVKAPLESLMENILLLPEYSEFVVPSSHQPLVMSVQFARIACGKPEPSSSYLSTSGLCR